MRRKREIWGIAEYCRAASRRLISNDDVTHVSMSISIGVFAQLDFRVGKIIEVDDIPQARKPIYRFKIDFGPLGVKQCAGGIKPYYTKEQLLGKQVVAVTNLEPKSVAGVISECMMLASFTETELSLLTPDKEMPLGTKVA